MPHILKPDIAFAVMIALGAATGPTFAGGLRIGDPAPGFLLPFATRDSIASEKLSLSDLLGKHNIVLAFYPADWSLGCTKEMCTMRDDWNALAKLDAEILAISGDYEWSHYEWAKHHNLPFRLLADHSHEVSRTYSSYNESSGYNRRTVYVIDRKGNIAYIDLAYSVRDLTSFNNLQEALRRLK